MEYMKVNMGEGGEKGRDESSVSVKVCLMSTRMATCCVARTEYCFPDGGTM